MKSLHRGLAVLAGIACVYPTGAEAAAKNPVRSVYTALEPDGCKVTKRHADGNAYECAGLAGYPVYFAEGDLRTFVAFGAKPAARRAATQTLGAFNTPFEGKKRRATIEWRVPPNTAVPAPYAAIVRYFVSRDGVKGEALVVSKVSATESCHVAYIDAKANADAIMVARRIADEVAPRFDCAKEPTIEGVRGKLLD
jgi:hypothetical protein